MHRHANTKFTNTGRTRKDFPHHCPFAYLECTYMRRCFSWCTQSVHVCPEACEIYFWQQSYGVYPAKRLAAQTCGRVLNKSPWRRGLTTEHAVRGCIKCDVPKPKKPDHQPIDHRFVPWVGGSCWSKCVTLPHYAILSYTIPVAFPGAVNFQCGLLVLLCAVLRGTSMRPQNSGTVVTWLLRLCPEIGHTQNPKKISKNAIWISLMGKF